MATRTVTYETNFVTGFSVTDSGKDAEGKPCWQSRFPYGRIVNNDEKGLYGDKAVFPDMPDPFPIVKGRRRLRSDKLATPIQWRGKAYTYSGSLMTSDKVFDVGIGDRVECRLAMPCHGQRGAWPAFWLMPKDGSWPPEIDVMEYPQTPDAHPSKYWSNQHWTETGKHKADPKLVQVSGALADFRTFIVDISAKEIVMWIGGTLVSRRPNKSPGKRWYVILNMAMGGSWPGDPTPDTQFPADMILDRMRVIHTA